MQDTVYLHNLLIIGIFRDSNSCYIAKIYHGIIYFDIRDKLGSYLVT